MLCPIVILPDAAESVAGSLIHSLIEGSLPVRFQNQRDKAAAKLCHAFMKNTACWLSI